MNIPCNKPIKFKMSIYAQCHETVIYGTGQKSSSQIENGKKMCEDFIYLFIYLAASNF